MGNEPSLLARPGKIGTMELKNRLIMPAMCTNYTRNGHFTDAACHYYGLRAKGGVGLIIIEAAAIDYPIGRSVINCSISGDEYIASHKKLTDSVHAGGAKIACRSCTPAGRLQRRLPGRSHFLVRRSAAPRRWAMPRRGR